MKSTLLAVALGLAALPMLASSASAHGCHRDVQEGRAGWHRHVGRDCERVEARNPREYRERYYRERRPQCEIKCKYIGPFKNCEKVCY